MLIMKTRRIVAPRRRDNRYYPFLVGTCYGSLPEVQRRAQAELDTVVGRDRLPTFADAPSLPYVSAVIKEVLRWRPSVPLGLPHATIEDDWYEGMFIPKGTVCIPNAWHCNHDRAIFGEDADEFRPERHLDERGELLAGPQKRTRQAMSRLDLGGASAWARNWLLMPSSSTQRACCGQQISSERGTRMGMKRHSMWIRSWMRD